MPPRASLIVFLVSFASVAHAQAAGSIRGAVRYEGSGEPLIGVRILATPRSVPTHAAITSTDSSGTSVITQLPDGPVDLLLTCPQSAGDSHLMFLAQQRAEVVSGREVVLKLSIPSGFCTRAALRAVHGTYAGHYTAGYETSVFVPCPSPSVPPRLIGFNLNAEGLWGTYAWVTGADASDLIALAGGTSPQPIRGTVTYFVRWRGTLEGPGSYGHFGVAEYAFAVDTVLEARAPDKADCDAAESRPAP